MDNDKYQERTISVQKLMYADFFSTQGPVIQIAVPKGRGATGKFFHDKVLTKLKWHYSKSRPKSGIKNKILFHDHVPSH